MNVETQGLVASRGLYLDVLRCRHTMPISTPFPVSPQPDPTGQLIRSGGSGKLSGARYVTWTPRPCGASI